jgi:hypothetical protein
MEGSLSLAGTRPRQTRQEPCNPLVGGDCVADIGSRSIRYHGVASNVLTTKRTLKPARANDSRTKEKTRKYYLVDIGAAPCAVPSLFMWC